MENNSNKTIVCFSGTGNSFYVATQLKEKLGYDEVLLMPDVVDNPKIYHNPKELGIIFPTYFLKPVNYLRTFVEEIVSRPEMDNLEYLFIITTYGSFISKSLNIAERLLGYNDCYISYCNKVKMVDSYSPLFTIPKEDKIKLKYKKADQKIELIAQEILSNKVRIPSFKLGLGPSFKNYLKRVEKVHTSPFFVGEECTKCMLCIEGCPGNAIELKEGKVVFTEGCQDCWGCYHRCPVHAIKYEGIKNPTYYKNEKSGFKPIYERGNNEIHR